MYPHSSHSTMENQEDELKCVEPRMEQSATIWYVLTRNGAFRGPVTPVIVPGVGVCECVSVSASVRVCDYLDSLSCP